MKVESLSEFLLVVDEIQKIDNWAETVKREWDFDTRKQLNIKVILLGSSRLLIQKGLTESLAGRFESIYVPHWSFAEMQAAFGWTFEQYVYFGGYPGAADLITDEKRWRDYIRNSLIETSISKDILMLTRVDKPALLRQLFELGAAHSGQILPFNKILGQLLDAGNTTTLSNYLTLLADAGLLGGIEKFSGSVINQRSSSPKFQVFNNALFTAQKDLTFQNALHLPDVWGRLAESAIGTQLINHRIKENYRLFYWREGNSEVDFVLERGEKTVAVEVKSGRSQKNAGMNVFIKKYPTAKPLLTGKSGISCEDFLKINPAELF
ncbi:MAG: DUF4143 domain-containing protein [Dysgonamonadaceae bacterium]|nr:DUF4143 domain-containing protein [Dysgonamonadaceae bacterium]